MQGSTYILHTYIRTSLNIIYINNYLQFLIVLLMIVSCSPIIIIIIIIIIMRF